MPSNYPPGAEHDPNAPYNEPVIPEVEFTITTSITLSKTVSVFTDDYIPEFDDENGSQDCNTSETDWEAAYTSNHYTVPQLLDKLREYVQKDLDNVHNIAETEHKDEAFLRRKYERLIEECSDWIVDEEAYVGE